MILFKDDDFRFGLEIALGCSYRQASGVGEVLATAVRIKDGDADSWSGAGSPPLRSSDIAVDSRGFGREIEFLARRDTTDFGSLAVSASSVRWTEHPHRDALP
jgi:hypothetical protein